MEAEALGTAATVLSKPINDLYELGKDRFKSKLSKIKTSSQIKKLYKKLSSVHKVKTIWQVDKEISLKSFYYPSKIVIEGKSTNINAIKKLPPERNTIIQGIVGQGKSIFLRYLCYQELNLGERIPIFIELRRIEDGDSLKSSIIRALDAYGFEIDEELFEFLCESGKLVFLFDGFDEVKKSLSLKIITELEFLSEKYPNLKIIVSSRPDSGIENSPWFRVYKIAPLAENDFEGILIKLLDQRKRAEEILNAIERSGSGVKTLLTTPLMITLLVIIYKAEQKIPEQLSEFYESLFPTLLYRHDKSKPGYMREKYSNLNERKLQQVFEAFCFISRKRYLSEISTEEMHEISDKASLASQLPCDSSDFINDITKISNLIVQEGYNYRFIHKSVQEFYAANYVRNRPEKAAIEFYASLRSGPWNQWNQELAFLSQIDGYRFKKYFLIPLNSEFLNKVGIQKEWKELSIETIKEILSKTYIEIDNKDGTRIIRSFRVGSIMSGYELIDTQIRMAEKMIKFLDKKSKGIFSVFDEPGLVSKYSKFIKKSSLEDEDEILSFLPIFEAENLIQKAKEIISDEIHAFFQEHIKIIKFVENEEKNISLLSL